MNYSNKMTTDEIKSCAKNVLEIFAEFCEQNDLKYYLAYGPLIGAVRHNGFIPWDDDIDLEMPRNDYNRLMEILEKIDYNSENFARFKEGLENDLATPIALSAIQKEANGKGGVKASDALSSVYKMDKVLSLSLIENAFKVLEEQKKTETPQTDDHAGDPEAEAITALVAERTAAKKAKDFEKADKIRNDLLAKGIIIIDTPNGAVWKRS